jgi:Amt family ammonium transporter
MTVRCASCTELSCLTSCTAVDVFALHGVGGYVGAVLTGLFADSRVTGFNGITEIPGGWIVRRRRHGLMNPPANAFAQNQNYVQLGYQFADATAILAYSFVMTYIVRCSPPAVVPR